MEIAVKELEHVEVITIDGRMDSIEAPRFEKALQDAGHRGKHNLVIDMSRLEYMSSAGFRALAAAQRNSQRHKRGDVVLVQVPDLVREALELVGFAGHFNFYEDLDSALSYFDRDTAGPVDAPPLTSET